MTNKQLRLMEMDISSRDRVEISLSKYEKMRDEIERKKNEIQSLKFENDRLRTLIDKVGLPFDKPIRLINSTSYHEKDPMHMKHRFKVILDYEMDDAEFR